jgi:hypothetical protein
VINNIESYNKKQLIELVELQIEEYRKLLAENDLLKKERDAYKKVLLYCKHNKSGQGSRINGVLWEFSDDV